MPAGRQRPLSAATPERGAAFTVLVVPERSASVRRFQVPRVALARLGMVALGLLAVASSFAVHYAFLVHEAAAVTRLREQNVWLNVRLRGLIDEVAHIEQTLGEVRHLVAQVRQVARVHDPARELSLGPLGAEGLSPLPAVLDGADARPDGGDEALDSRLALRILDAGLEDLGGRTRAEADAARDLAASLAGRGGLLTTTPSIRPIRSRAVRSRFGPRRDPFTDREVLHKGVDFAAEHGAEVLAPADGVAIFVGSRDGALGRTVVLDHGFGIQTHFAHLGGFAVDLGEAVRRGQKIGAVGATGRTTGAHLHYEVRVGGVPEDPERFILD